METYIAKADNVLGIKKGDIIHLTNDQYVLQKNGTVIPFDVKNETSYFEFRPEIRSLFKRDDVVHFTHRLDLEIMSSPTVKSNVRRNTFNVPAYTEMKVIDVVVDQAATRRRVKTIRSNYYYIVKAGEYTYKVPQMQETLMVKTEVYWFISSKGVVQKEIANKNIGVDEFRKKSKNYFSDNTSAGAVLQKIIES